jgi:RNA polymerase sigma-54 factor
VIQKIQAFDPPGVAARDLRECLILQAQQLYPQEPLVQRIISDHLHLLAKKNYQTLSRELGAPLEEVIRATRLIGELDPHPGRRFNDENIPYITPDVYVFKMGDDYLVMLNEDGFLSCASTPITAASCGTDPVLREAKEYINDKSGQPSG